MFWLLPIFPSRSSVVGHCMSDRATTCHYVVKKRPKTKGQPLQFKQRVGWYLHVTLLLIIILILCFIWLVLLILTSWLSIFEIKTTFPGPCRSSLSRCTLAGHSMLIWCSTALCYVLRQQNQVRGLYNVMTRITTWLELCFRLKWISHISTAALRYTQRVYSLGLPITRYNHVILFRLKTN